MTKIISTKHYERRLKKCKQNHPNLKVKYSSTIQMLEKNPYHPSLRLHKLNGHLQQFHSISLNFKYRILLDFIIKDDQVILLDIGSHDQLYGGA